MYQSYFHFSEAPFTIAPNPRFLYLSERHREALAHLQYGLQENGGFILLTGEVGTGKTTVWRCLASQIPDNVHLAVVLNPRLTETDLIESICDEFGVTYETGCGLKRLVDALNRHLLQLHERGERAVLIVEEAQNLDTPLLEQLRLLTNLETDESKLLQIILIGQPELLDKIDSPDLRQLRQRITARFHLTALNAAEVRAYIAHRLGVVGAGPGLFTDWALLRLAKWSGGIPRLINLICDRALLGCFSENKHQVDARILERAAREVLGEKARKPARAPVAAPARIGLAAAGLALLATGVWWYGIPYSGAPDDAAPPPLAQSPAVQGAATDGDTLLAETPPVQPRAQSPVAQTLLLQSPVAGTPSAMPPAPAAPPLSADWRDGVVAGTPANQPANAPYRTLFGLWNIRLPREWSESPCEFALRHRLDCWHRRGSLVGLERANRPALLKMIARRNGRPFYAVLEGFSASGLVQLDVAGGKVAVARSQLDEVWTGEYTLLWRRPAGYLDTLYPGDKNDTVRWVARQLASLTGDRVLLQHATVYTPALENRIRNFQRQCGLFVDGLIGKETLIRMNALVGKAPLLRNEVLSCRSRLG